MQTSICVYVPNKPFATAICACATSLLPLLIWNIEKCSNNRIDRTTLKTISHERALYFMRNTQSQLNTDTFTH